MDRALDEELYGGKRNCIALGGLLELDNVCTITL